MCADFRAHLRLCIKVLISAFSSLMTTVNGPMPVEEAIERAEELYYEGAVRMFRFVKTGMDMR